LFLVVKQADTKVLGEDAEKIQTYDTEPINKTQVGARNALSYSVYCPKSISNKRPELDSAIDTETLFRRSLKDTAGLVAEDILRRPLSLKYGT
jgi:hypothetical protein